MPGAARGGVVDGPGGCRDDDAALVSGAKVFVNSGRVSCLANAG